MTEKKLTVSERQISAIFAIIQSSNLTGARFPISHGPEVERRTAEHPRAVSVENYLTSHEMHDLQVRLRMFLYPLDIPEAAVTVEVAP